MALTAEPVSGKPFSFARLAQMLEDGGGLQEGAVGGGDFKVTQRAAGGANMSVDVAVGQAWVEVDSGVRQGLRHVVNDAIANAVVAASHATLPRIDLVVLQYNDTAIPAGVGGDVPTIRVLTGTPTASVTLDAPGASPAALPADAMLIGTLLIPAASTSVTNGNIRDRRKFARGFNRRIVMTNRGSNYASTATALTPVDLTNLYPRCELGGNPVECILEGWLQQATSGTRTDMKFWVDGAVAQADAGAGVAAASFQATVANDQWSTSHPITLLLAAGSHRIGPAWGQSAAGTLTLWSSGPGDAVTWRLREILGQNADNT